MKARPRGFSLIELLIVIAIIAILVKLAYPTYNKYIVRISREQAEATLLQLANLEEKIFLNSNAYAVASTSVTAAYTGNSTGGLGLTAGTTPDGKYTITVAPTVSGSTTDYTLTAAPVAGTTQVGDGNITINTAGARVWGSGTW